ncbi:MAG TPA: hypothetical protein VNR66_00070 [Solirubrobacteraceae bacterium]|nr:hypothetical protein [Solirubrobacteraceae bacterium]
MAQRLRMKAAVCTGVAPATSPQSPAKLSTLQGIAPGGSLGLLSLSAHDNSLTTLNGSLLGSLLTPVVTLLAALNPAAPTPIAQTVTDLQAIGAAPGASVPDGSLVPVGAVLTSLAGQGGSPRRAFVLNSAATTLNGSSALSPGTLLGVIGQLQYGAGSLPAPLNGVARALATQLAGSTTVFGQLVNRQRRLGRIDHERSERPRRPAGAGPRRGDPRRLARAGRRHPHHAG